MTANEGGSESISGPLKANKMDHVQAEDGATNKVDGNSIPRSFRANKVDHILSERRTWGSGPLQMWHEQVLFHVLKGPFF